jgi:EAL domain-containing protein (putative c-di-GMP-specific phosphodiesterase class I)
MRNGAIVGAEALVRWRDPELGEMSPGRFIPVAEETGFIIAIGDWVLTQAVNQCAAWRLRGHVLPVSVNVSALQFQQADFYDRVALALQTARLPANLLELELTETILVGDVQDMTARLQRLHDLGVRLAIDDFGTGYSSLGYLKRFPIDRLKIDRSFIDKLPDDESDAVITRAVIHLARALNLKVIAEGVETDAQRHFLLEAGCDEFQGWLFSPAVPAGDFEALMAGGLAAVA